MKLILTLTLAGILVLSCKNNNTKQNVTSEEMIPVEPDGGNGAGAPSLEDAFLQTIARAHHKDAFLAHEAVSFDIKLNFGGDDRLDAKVTLLTDWSKIRLDKNDGSSLIFDGNEVYLTPNTASDQDARFDIFTWPYFFSFPYKLEDDGAVVTPLGMLDLNEESLDAFKLTFKDNTGDSPDDWYIGYLNSDQTINSAGYVVTFGDKSLETAEQNPHAIVYGDYITVDEVPFATSWQFYNWTKEAGLNGDPIGSATLSSIQFLNPKAGLFDKPDTFVIVK